MPVYAIGDIHGQHSLLLDAHARIARDRAAYGTGAARVVHLGDLVDRGPDSAAVIATLRAGIAAGAPWDVLMGNHDRLLVGFLRDPGWHDPRLRAGLDYLDPRIGGRATLASYGVPEAALADATRARAAAQACVPDADLAFLASRPQMLQMGAQLFVHAGIRPGTPLAHQTEDDLLWIRAPFLSDPRDHGPLVVHGHTALPAPRHYRNRLNLDSGAAYGGPLSAVVLDGRRAWLLTAQGRTELSPA